MFRKLLVAVAALALLCAVPLAQAPAPSPAGQASPTKGVVIKGKAPVSDQVLRVALPRPREADLPNGVHLMVLEDHRLPQITMQMIIPGAGGYFAPPDNPEIAAFTGSMMAEGTATRTAQQIAQELEASASTLNFGAGPAGESAMMSLTALTDNFDKTLALASDVLLNATFPEAELARLKTRQKAQLVQMRMIPQYLAMERFSQVVYGDHPGSRMIPTVTGIDKTTRDSLVAFHKARYVPDHAIVALAGDIALADARAKIEKAFASWKKAGVPEPVVKDPGPIGPAKVYLVDRANSVQTSLMIGTQAISRISPDYDVLQLLNAVIGGGPTGRLFLNLREDKGWTYGAYSGLTTQKYVGDWSASTEIRGDVTGQAVGEIMNEIARLRSEPVADKEFADKKRSAVASFALSLENPTQILSRYMTSRQYKLPADYWDKYPERVMAITQAQVQAAAKKYLDAGRIQIVAVGDAKKIGEGLKKFGTVEVYDTEGKPKATT